VTGTSNSGFSPMGVQGGAGIGTTPLTNWYWFNTGSNTFPTAATIAQVTAPSFNPTSNGWKSGIGWNSNVLTAAGYAFFRTNLPNLSGPHTVYFTNVADNATVYLNGTNIVGTSTAATTPFTVSLDSHWSTSGTNVLTVLVQDCGLDGDTTCGINGGVLMNPISGAIPNWKMQGGLGPIEGSGLTWQSVGATGGTPTFYHATFNYDPPSGLNPILRAGYAGLTNGHIWLNGHPLGRYPQVIPITGIYLPECWLTATNNTIDYFEEQGAAPTSASLFVETTASRQVYNAQDLNGAMLYGPATLTASGQNGKVVLNWTSVTGAAGYNIMRSGTSGGPYTQVASNAPGLSYTDSGVTNGNTYYYVVAAESNGSQSANSAEASATPFQIIPAFVNPSFELPGTGKIQSGFSTVSGWSNAGSSYANSGVESTPASYSGLWHAFCKGSDGGCYQLTSYPMQLGDLITITWWAEHTGGSGTSSQIVHMISSPIANGPYANTTVLVSNTSALNGNGSSPGPWTEYSLTYTATTSDVGNYVGVFFNNATSSNWAGFDDFNVSVVSVPNAPQGLTAYSGNGSVTLNWPTMSNADSYNLKRGT